MARSQSPWLEPARTWPYWAATSKRQIKFASAWQQSWATLSSSFCDVLNREALLATADNVQNRFGQVDLLVNAAGGKNPSATVGAGADCFDLPPDMVRWVFDLNCIGTILPCQVFGKRMAQQSQGSILNVVSMAAFRPLTRVVAYSAAKAAVSNFTQWLAVHVAQEYSPNVRLNAIAPGFFLTSQNRFLLKDAVGTSGYSVLRARKRSSQKGMV